MCSAESAAARVCPLPCVSLSLASMPAPQEVQTIEEFQKAALQHRHAVVFFWAPWSEPCVALNDVFKDAALESAAHCMRVRLEARACAAIERWDDSTARSGCMDRACTRTLDLQAPHFRASRPHFITMSNALMCSWSVTISDSFASRKQQCDRHQITACPLASPASHACAPRRSRPRPSQKCLASWA